MTNIVNVSNEYTIWLADLKKRVRESQVRAMVSVNAEMMMLYWQIGRDILDRQIKHGWGAKIVDQLSSDLKREFPEMTGFSPRNLNYMLAFASAWPDQSILQQTVAKLP